MKAYLNASSEYARHTKGSPMSALVAIHRLLSFLQKFQSTSVGWLPGGVGGGGWSDCQQVRKTNNSTCLFLFSVLDYIFVIEAQNNAVKRGKKTTTKQQSRAGS